MNSLVTMSACLKNQHPVNIGPEEMSTLQKIRPSTARIFFYCDSKVEDF